MDNIFRRIGVDVPEPVRRFLQGETDFWLRIEEYREGNTLVVRTDIPGIDPEKDVDITVTDDTLHIQARRGEKPSTRTRRVTGAKSAMGSSPAVSRCPAG